MDALGFDNSIDSRQGKYFHCSLYYAHVIAGFKQCAKTFIIRPNTLQVHMAALQTQDQAQGWFSRYSHLLYLWQVPNNFTSTA